MSVTQFVFVLFSSTIIIFHLDVTVLSSFSVLTSGPWSIRRECGSCHVESWYIYGRHQSRDCLLAKASGDRCPKSLVA